MILARGTATQSDLRRPLAETPRVPWRAGVIITIAPGRGAAGSGLRIMMVSTAFHEEIVNNSITPRIDLTAALQFGLLEIPPEIAPARSVEPQSTSPVHFTMITDFRDRQATPMRAFPTTGTRRRQIEVH